MLIALSLNVVYAMWFDKLRANVKVTLGSFDLKITSQKFLCEYCDGDESYIDVSGDGKSVQVFVADAEPNSAIWVGLVLSNEGSLPLKLIQVSVLGCDDSEFYVYGPFQAPGTSGVWDRVRLSDLPFYGDVGLPSPGCDPSKKLIVWIKMMSPELEGVEARYTITLSSVLST